MSTVKRVGLVIGLKPEKIEYYKSLHADSHPGVRDLLTKYHIRNFSIYTRKLDDCNHYLFGHFEYVGDNYEVDMKKLAAEPRNIEWLGMCDPCQTPLAGETSWAVMDEVYHND